MKRLLTILLALTLCVSVCACAGAAELDEELPVHVMVLNGSTGFGMAQLMAAGQAGDAALRYDFSVETDAANVTAALINGGCDIAALPTNAAAAMFNKTEGGVQLLALNTLGVLYVVVNGDALTVQSMDDLAGLTVYAPAQNPKFLFQALCDAFQVDVTIDDTYAQPADLRTALAAGEVDIAVLPEPMVTIACAANESLVPALDLTAQWQQVYPESSLVQGCVVARTQFIQEHPAEIEAFLQEYGASIDYVLQEPEAAARLIEQTGIFSNAAVAEKAIPRCNLCFITGDEMQHTMDGFLQVLCGVAPESIGGAVPGDEFYYKGQ